jgi:hypothetical protein
VSDLNYLIRTAHNKEVTVNVNKMKKCCMIPLSSRTGREENQDVTEDEEVTSSAPHDHVGNESNSVPAPLTMTEKRFEDQNQDPT